MGVEIQNTTNKQQLAEKTQMTTEIQWITEVLKRSYNNYSGKVGYKYGLTSCKVTRPSLWT